MHDKNYQIKWSIKDAIFLLILIVLITFAVTIISVLFLPFVKKNAFLGILAINFFSFLSILIFKKIKKTSWKTFGFVDDNNKRIFLKGILYGTTLFLINNLVLYPNILYKLLLSFRDAKRVIIASFLAPFVLGGFVAIFVSPIIEEILFRGIIYKAFILKYRKFVSILMVSVLFSIMHFNIYLLEYKQIIIIFTTSVLLTYLFDSYKNIVVSIGCHIAINYLAFILKILT